MNSKKFKKTILLVDDTIEIRSLLHIRFKELEYDVIEAENGKVALECLSHLKPDLVVSDFLMPVMNGLELCRILKTDENTRMIPILMLSSFPFTSETIAKMNQLGIDSFMMKPYSFDELLECVEELLRRKDSTPKKLDFCSKSQSV